MIIYNEKFFENCSLYSKKYNLVSGEFKAVYGLWDGGVKRF